ncbi:MAG: hypothetical protein ACNS60_03085 [Candidatus Cyclobacteriaceae bacterium M2_1C_046]
MNKKSWTQYLIGAVLVAFSIYQMYRNEPWEFALYSVTGAAFITMGLIKDKMFPRYRQLLNVLSWILILLSIFLLIFLIRTD